MSIIKAYVMPHPPLAVPAVGRGKEREIGKTLAALDEVAIEIAALKPETIIFITPHNVMYADYFHISPGKESKYSSKPSATGDLSRFGAPDVMFSVDYDAELIDEISQIAHDNNFPAGTMGERDASLDHAYTVPAWFINQRYTDYKAIRVCQSGMDATLHYKFGQIITAAVKSLGRKAVLVASGDLSHKLTAEGPYGFAPEGKEFDSVVSRVLESGDFLALLKISDSLRENAGECGYNSLTILAGCFDRINVDSKLLSYEGPFGVGYAVAGVEPLYPDLSRNIVERFIESSLMEIEMIRKAEDDYRALARRSLESVLMTGRVLSVPNDVPKELKDRQAGVFVSLHKNGRLRGCIGTITPVVDSIAQEIINNAVSAGLNDSRFDSVAVSELPHLVYKVDVLAAPESISSSDELDVKKYGVIVSSGFKRGLLLPNLDGVNTVDEQISIAMQKAGISKSEKISLERFEVTRYE